MWPGEVVAILATGPSLTKALPYIERAKCKAIAVNDAYRVAPWADMLYAADCVWWKHHVEAVRKFAGMKVTLCGQGAEAERLLIGGTKGFDPRPTHLRTGSNSTYQAAHIAIHAGARKVVFFGLDLHTLKGKHFFGAHPKPLRNTHCYRNFIARFGELAVELRKIKHPVQIVNATPGSACNAFPIVDPASEWWR